MVDRSGITFTDAVDDNPECVVCRFKINEHTEEQLDNCEKEFASW